MSLIAKIANWRWAPTVALTIAAVFNWVSPRSSCKPQPWWAYALPLVVFVVFSALILRKRP